MPPRLKKKVPADTNTAKIESIIFVDDVHPGYRKHFVKYCELKGFAPLVYTDLRKESYFTELGNTATIRPARRGLRRPTPVPETPVEEITPVVTQTSGSPPAPKTWIAYPSDINFDTNSYRLDQINDPNCPASDTSRVTLERARPPYQSRQIKLVGKNPHEGKSVTPLSQYYSGNGNNSAYYVIPYSYGSNSADYDDNSSYKAFSFAQSWIPLSAEDQADLKNWVSDISGWSGYASFLKKMLKGTGKEFSLIQAPFVEGLNYGKRSKDICEYGGCEYILRGELIFSVREALDVRKAIGTKLKEVSNMLANRPVPKEEFQSIFFRSFSTKNKEAIEKSEKTIKKYNSALMLEEARLGEYLFVEKSIKKNSKGIVEGLVDKIAAIPEIAEFKLTRRGFWFKTGDLFIEHENEKYYCGVFEVSCNIFETKGFIYQNVQSPAFALRRNHVLNNPHGSCTGSYSTMLNSCLRDLDYYSFVLTFLQMLKNVNPNDYGAMDNFRKYWQKHKTKPAKTKVASESVTVYSSDDGPRTTPGIGGRRNRDKDDDDDDD